MSNSMEMPRYRSHKTVWALKISSVTDRGTDTTTNEGQLVELAFEDTRYAPRIINIGHKPVPEPGWYFVQYRDGYTSFSPAKEFEDGNTLESECDAEAVTHHDGIGWAIKQMHNGAKVRRAGWNGKGMFLVLCPGSVFVVNRKPYSEIFPEGTSVYYQPHVDMFTANGTVVPWLASQTDLLAIDWELAE